MHKSALATFILLLAAPQLGAFWQGPMLLFRREPDGKSGPSTKLLAESFDRLPSLPPAGAVVSVAKVDDSVRVAPIKADSLMFPSVGDPKTSSDFTRLFESNGGPPSAVPAAPATVTLPTDTPEVQISPGK